MKEAVFLGRCLICSVLVMTNKKDKTFLVMELTDLCGKIDLPIVEIETKSLWHQKVNTYFSYKDGPILAKNTYL